MARASDHNGCGGCPARRTVLLGLVSAGLLAATGCAGSSGSTGGQPAARTRGAGSTAASRAAGPATDPSYTPWPDLGGDTRDGLVRSADVPVGAGVLAGGYLVVQPRKGTFRAFDAKCPRQGVTVDPPVSGNEYMNCPDHNSRFKVADGSRISGPATRGLRQVAVKLKAGLMILA